MRTKHYYVGDKAELRDNNKKRGSAFQLSSDFSSTIKAVVFDLDGTLYDEKDFMKSGFKEVSKYLSSKYSLNPETIFETLKKDFDSGLRRKNFDVMLEKMDLEEDIKSLVKIYRGHSPSISLYDDAKEALKWLKIGRASCRERV